MMLDAIGMLENDPQTEIIVLISKPPAPAVARKVLERARACRKPMVVCFSVVAKRQWMSRGYSLPAAAKRRH